MIEYRLNFECLKAEEKETIVKLLNLSAVSLSEPQLKEIQVIKNPNKSSEKQFSIKLILKVDKFEDAENLGDNICSLIFANAGVRLLDKEFLENEPGEYLVYRNDLLMLRSS